LDSFFLRQPEDFNYDLRYRGDDIFFTATPKEWQ
jgi:hypothetical protein